MADAARSAKEAGALFTFPMPTNDRRDSSLLGIISDDSIKAPEGLLFRSVFCPQTLGIIVGKRGLGKSFLAMDMAIRLPAGDSLGGVATKRARTLYISQEMPRSIVKPRLEARVSKEQAEAIGNRMNIECQVEGLKLDRDTGILLLANLIDKHSPDIVFLDSLKDVKGNADFVREIEIGRVVNNLRVQIAEKLGPAIVMIHHPPKNYADTGTGLSSRGAAVIEDECSDVIYMERDQDFPRYRRILSCGKARNQEEWSDVNMDLVVDEDRSKPWYIEYEIKSSESGMAGNVRQLRQLLSANGNQMFQDEIQRKMSWSRTTAWRILKLAADAGLVTSRAIGSKKYWELVETD